MVDAGDDGALLDGARSGDREAFLALVAEHVPLLYDVLFQVVGHAGRAMVLTGEAIRRAAENAGAAPVGASARAWLVSQAWPLLGVAAARGEVVPSEARAGLACEAAAGGWERHAYLDLGLRQRFGEHELAQAAGISRSSAASLLARLPASMPPGFAERYAAETEPAVLPAGVASGWVRDAERWYGGGRPSGPATPTPTVGAPRWGQRWLWGAALAGAVAGLAALLFIPGSPVALTRGAGDRVFSAAPTATPGSGAPPSGTPSATRTPTRTPVRATPSASPRATATPSAGPTRTAAAGLTATPIVSTATATPARSPTPTPTATATLGASPTPVPTPTPTATGTANPTATPTPTATACLPVLQANVSRLTAPPGQQTFFVLFNGFCGAATFVVEASDGWLSAGPPSGTLAAGTSTQISVVADPPAEPGAYSATVRVSGPSNSVVVTVESTRR
ncbi:MAG: BACON domain-containing protein [Dehalococcoidia bacterium]